MPSLAWQNIFHDKVRFAVTITGIVFSIVLIVVLMGLFIGFNVSISSCIDNAGADIWITANKVPYLEVGTPFSERKRYKALATKGVASVEKYITRFCLWKKPDGGIDQIQVIGYNPDAKLGSPWNIVEGYGQLVKAPDSIIVDRFYCKKLGISHVGQVVEINGHRARIVGFTENIISFTTAPYVFTSFKNAQNYMNLPEDQTLYLLVKAEPGVDIKKLKELLRQQISTVDVLTANEFSSMTRFYWLFTTGAGITVLIGAIMGLVVGIVVVTQTIYATTMDHLREFGTLKAIGASNGYIYKVIIQQAVISAVIGYSIGIVASHIVVSLSGSGGATILAPLSLDIAMFFVTLAMCIGASVVSIRKVTYLDPAMVFKG